ncbi:MAG: DUF4091 domain-containing protein [Clostridia bacterium]|nr:DUF4091 domain-containing protein [Clostridia bacterium]
MYIWTEPSTKSIFMNTRPGKGASANMIIDCPRNAYCSGQIAVRMLENYAITGIELREKNSAKGEPKLRTRLFKQDYTRYNDNTFYPDRLCELKTKNMRLQMKAHRTQAFRIDFFIPKDAGTGERTYCVTVKTDKGDLSAELTLRIHSAKLRDPAESAFGHEYFFNLELLPHKEAGVAGFSDEWWKLLEHYADVMKELRNNTICIQPLPLLHRAGSTYKNAGEFDFRFDLFDRFAELFINKGAARDFTLSAFIQSVEGKTMSALGETGDVVAYDTLTKEADEYLRTFYGELNRHIEEKGWKGMFRVHIEDEPHTTEVWLHTKEILDEVAPSLLPGEPLDMLESAETICDHCQWAVPRINVHDEGPEVFEKFVDRGAELWLYSCCFPEEAYFLNKFVDLPVIRSRLMEWACVNVGAKGFLHWGFNYWGKGDSLYGFNADARFKGDGAIVYANNRSKKLDLSSRFMNMRDGLQDADLFMQIFEKGSKKAKKDAKDLLKSVCFDDFESHSDDDEAFRQAFLKLLEIADSI